MRSPEAAKLANETWRRKHRDRYNASMRKYNKQYIANLRKIVFDHYGRKCSCCGETIPQFLTIDHVNGGGSRHRKARNRGGVYLDIIRSGFPDSYRVLCMNCNWAIGQYGECPHGATV